MLYIISKSLQKGVKYKGIYYKYNPWAVCNSKIDKDENPEKYERCVKHVKNRSKRKKSHSYFNIKEAKKTKFMPEKGPIDAIVSDVPVKYRKGKIVGRRGRKYLVEFTDPDGKTHTEVIHSRRMEKYWRTQ